MMQTLVKLLSAIIILFMLASCSKGYEGTAFTGTVIHAWSREPVEKAIVVVVWAMEAGMHGSNIDPLEVQEVLTDKDGKFTIPAWGPIKAERGYMDKFAPYVFIWKPGYHYQLLMNDYSEPTGKLRQSKYNGGTFKLSPFRESAKFYEKMLLKLARDLGDQVGIGPRCDWYKTPVIIKTLQIEGERLPEKNRIDFFPSLFGEKRTYDEKCGPIDARFQGVQE